jgi:hypothetical protein
MERAAAAGRGFAGSAGMTLHARRAGIVRRIDRADRAPAA